MDSLKFLARYSKLTTRVAALGAGITEAVAVVTPMEVVKIRLQSQNPRAGIPRDGSAIQALIGIVKENGIRGLYSGLGLTALRQGTNQAGTLMANPSISL